MRYSISAGRALCLFRVFVSPLRKVRSRRLCPPFGSSPPNPAISVLPARIASRRQFCGEFLHPGGCVPSGPGPATSPPCRRHCLLAVYTSKTLRVDVARDTWRLGKPQCASIISSFQDDDPATHRPRHHRSDVFESKTTKNQRRRCHWLSHSHFRRMGARSAKQHCAGLSIP